MNDNYAVINGKRDELTDEQVKVLGIERKNPFERVNRDADNKYYYIRISADVSDLCDVNDNGDKLLYKVSNYFNDEAFANQVALHQLLYRKLLKFAYDNKCEDNQTWNKINCHYYIGYSINDGRFYADVTASFKRNDVWFSSRDSANRAIKEVVEPFMKEHPEFVWQKE